MIKKRLKSLLPTLKERNRYLAFEVISDAKIRDFRAVSRQMLASFSRFYGETGLAKANPVMLSDKWNEAKQTGIIKVSHNHIHELKSSLLFINRISHNDAIIRSIGTSGILKKAQSRYLAS
jgi:RNase P/RNase MRP subunit POP5